jgi:hypothetical protein
MAASLFLQSESPIADNWLLGIDDGEAALRAPVGEPAKHRCLIAQIKVP